MLCRKSRRAKISIKERSLAISTKSGEKTKATLYGNIIEECGAADEAASPLTRGLRF